MNYLVVSGSSCFDYLGLNKNVVADNFLLLLISDQISRLYGVRYFTGVDII